MMNSKNTGSMDNSVQYEKSNKNRTPNNDDKNGAKSKIRRAYLRDKKAPKPPLSGYLRFLNERRQQFCSQNSNLPFSEVTKILATEWNQMPADKKQSYLLAAEQERIKYVEEFEAYKKTDAYRYFMELKSHRAKYHIPVKKEQKLKKEKSSNDGKFKKDRELQKENPSNDTKFKKDQEFKKEKPSTSSNGDQEFKKEKPSTSSSSVQKFKKEKPSTSSNSNQKFKFKNEKPSTSSNGDQEFKKEKLSTSSNGVQKFKKEKPSTSSNSNQKFKNEKPSTSSNGVQKFKKEKPSTSSNGDQEFKKEKPSTSSSGNQEFKKGNLSISSDNNTVHDITIFTEEFLNFNKARDIELRNFRKKVTDQKQEVCVLEKHIENMQDFSTKLVAHNEQLNAKCSKYEQYLIKLRSKLLDAFANAAFPDNTAPPTHENIDEYIINYSRHQTTGTDTDPFWITYFKKGLSNLDSKQ